MRRALLWIVCCCAVARADTGADYQRGTVALAQQLLRLQSTARVLHTGAHPDDEDSALLALLARGYGARVAYLSLNRGEGGQNGLGSELYDALGLVRTEELLAARAIDGAEQMFGSVYDFGFSKSAAETLRFWGEQQTLGEVVAAIRRFRPQVVISRFAGDPGDGHGHHQVAGLLTRRAFQLAGDPRAFPEQFAQGLYPFTPAKLYLDRWGRDGQAQPLDVGAWSPLFGRSYESLAMEGRSCHRTQDMGRLEPRGSHLVRLTLLASAGEPEPSAGIFDGLDLRLTDLLPEPAPNAAPWLREARAQLVEAAAAVRDAQGVFTLNGNPRQAVGELARALRAFRRLAQAAQSAPAGPDTATLHLAIEQKLDECSRALALAAGIDLDAVADRATVTPGGKMTVSGQVFWPEGTRVDAVRLKLEAPDGWLVTPLEKVPLLGNNAPEYGAAFQVRVAGDAPPSQPYWLARPRRGDRYDIADPALQGLPLSPPALRLHLRLGLDGAVLSLVRPVTWRLADPRHGERRGEVTVLPPLTAGVLPELLLLTPQRSQPLTVSATLRNQTAAPAQGHVLLRQGDRELAAAPLTVAAGERVQARLTIADLPAGGGIAQLCWQADSQPPVPLRTLHTIDYPHIAPATYSSAAEVNLVPVDVRVPAGRSIGYIAGPGDDWPAALARLGLPVRVIDAATLDEPSVLRGLQTIIVGLRAYETNEELGRHNRQLLDWTASGGTLVVQYQKLPFAQGHFAAYPLTYSSPADRVTDETAPVRVLRPDHPLLSQPNKLGPADFAGWVQERGLYFPHQWDGHYVPLLECHDPGEPAQQGALLVAPVGQGAYVFCALALFRQLPAGVPGAYRILANLVAYEAAR